MENYLNKTDLVLWCWRSVSC